METLEQYIYDNNIRIDKIPLKYGPALYINYKGMDCIAVDYSRVNSKAEEYCIIAHELAHHRTGTTYNNNSSAIDKSRAEFRANKYMVYDILPFSKIKRFITLNKPNYAYEIAEEFGITEEVVEKALKLYYII